MNENATTKNKKKKTPQHNTNIFIICQMAEHNRVCVCVFNTHNTHHR